MHHIKIMKYFPLCLTWNHAKLQIFRSVRITISSICQMKERFWELMLLSTKSKVDILWVYSTFLKKKKKLGKALKTRFLTSDCLNHSIWVKWTYVTLVNLKVIDKLFLIEWRKFTNANKMLHFEDVPSGLTKLKPKCSVMIWRKERDASHQPENKVQVLQHLVVCTSRCRRWLDFPKQVA